MELNHKRSLTLSTIVLGFMSALLGVSLAFSVLMFSRGFIFDWVTYSFLAFGTLTGLVTFFLTDYHDMKKQLNESTETVNLPV